MLFGNRKGIKEIGYFAFPEINFEQNDSRLDTYSAFFFFFFLSVIFSFSPSAWERATHRDKIASDTCPLKKI